MVNVGNEWKHEILMTRDTNQLPIYAQITDKHTLLEHQTHQTSIKLTGCFDYEVCTADEDCEGSIQGFDIYGKVMVGVGPAGIGHNFQRGLGIVAPEKIFQFEPSESDFEAF